MPERRKKKKIEKNVWYCVGDEASVSTSLKLTVNNKAHFLGLGAEEARVVGQLLDAAFT